MDVSISVPARAAVLVTGASGYVAGWLVKRLLEEGLTVHATVRDRDDQSKTAHLVRMADALPGELKIFSANLLDDGSYDTAMSGCEYVFHTASPFINLVEDAQRDLVDPAVRGTANVLGSANRTPSVKRVVITSSVAAIFGDNWDLRGKPAGAFTEADWNETSSLEHQAYSYSKTLAERKAWEMVAEQDRWDLVALNPSLVIGPALNPTVTSESFSVVRMFADGTMRLGVPDWGMGVVDVRDVAEAHLRAAFLESAHGRYIISGHNTAFPAMARIVRDHVGHAAYPFPYWVAPNWTLMAVGRYFSKAMTPGIIKRNCKWPWIGDNSRGIRELGMTYRAMDEGLISMFTQLVRSGRLPRPRVWTRARKRADFSPAA